MIEGRLKFSKRKDMLKVYNQIMELSDFGIIATVNYDSNEEWIIDVNNQSTEPEEIVVEPFEDIQL